MLGTLIVPGDRLNIRVELINCTYTALLLLQHLIIDEVVLGVASVVYG